MLDLRLVVRFLVRLHDLAAGHASELDAAHCRRNHFITPSHNRLSTLLSHPAFPAEPVQRAATLIDLYLVSVLLDAGAGNAWSYTEKDGNGQETWKGGRSEGLAVASYHMFVEGVFSSDSSNKLQVDGKIYHSTCRPWTKSPLKRRD